MASTEHPLGPEHIAGCFALSRSANWNQNEADWRVMLEIGRESVYGEASEELLAEAAAELVREAMQ